METPKRLDLPTGLKNSTCPYCGVAIASLKKKDRTRDHVIGENFVPAGSLKGKWNLILNACQPCNNRKSDLENDISAITLQPTPTGQFAEESDLIRSEAARKGRSVSRRTGKCVSDSQERLVVKTPFAQGSLSVGGVSGPQLDDERALRLAALHSFAFFYFVTYRDDLRKGLSPPGLGQAANIALRSDWGNAVQREFAQMTAEWPIRFGLITANGYFKAVIRRRAPSDLWSWAYEWNLGLRLVGFLGDDRECADANASLPVLTTVVIARDDKCVTRFREETPLVPGTDDALFCF